MDPVAFTLIFVELFSLSGMTAVQEHKDSLAELTAELSNVIPVHDGQAWTESRQWCVFMALRAVQAHKFLNESLVSKLRALPH